MEEFKFTKHLRLRAKDEDSSIKQLLVK